jgi:hypothetical protein
MEDPGALVRQASVRITIADEERFEREVRSGGAVEGMLDREKEKGKDERWFCALVAELPPYNTQFRQPAGLGGGQVERRDSMLGDGDGD